MIYYWVGRYARTHRDPVARVLHAATVVPVRLLTGVEIPVDVSIGDGFRIAYYGGTIINGACRIGAGCTLEQGVLLGGDRGAPVLQDGVRVGARAVVLGSVTVREGAVVGAGAVVVKDVPARHAAVGSTAWTQPLSERHRWS